MFLAAQPEIIAKGTEPKLSASADALAELPDVSGGEELATPEARSGQANPQHRQAQPDASHTKPSATNAFGRLQESAFVSPTTLTAGSEAATELHRNGSRLELAPEALSDKTTPLNFAPAAKTLVAQEHEAAPLLNLVDAPESSVITREIGKLSVELRQLGADTVAVVIHPDPHSALFMRLRLRGGQVHVRAQVEQGDHATFQSRWPELQASLARQNIVLEPLVIQEATSIAGKEAINRTAADQHQHNARQPRKPVLDTPATPVLRPAAAAAETGKKHRRHAGWEFWA